MPNNRLIRLLNSTGKGAWRALKACRLVAAIISATILSGSFAQTSQASERLPGIIGVDNRTPVDSKSLPWSAIGRINRESGGFCTGVLIATNKALTAAHCPVEFTRWSLVAGRMPCTSSLAGTAANTPATREGLASRFSLAFPSQVGENSIICLTIGRLSNSTSRLGPRSASCHSLLSKKGSPPSRSVANQFSSPLAIARTGQIYCREISIVGHILRSQKARCSCTTAT